MKKFFNVSLFVLLVILFSGCGPIVGLPDDFNLIDSLKTEVNEPALGATISGLQTAVVEVMETDIGIVLPTDTVIANIVETTQPVQDTATVGVLTATLTLTPTAVIDGTETVVASTMTTTLIASETAVVSVTSASVSSATATQPAVIPTQPISIGTATPVSVPATATSVSVPATSTLVVVIPSATQTLPTATQLSATSTAVPPTETFTPVPAVTATNTLVPPTNTQIPPSNTPAPSACSPSGNGGIESQIIQLINAERANQGLPALQQQNQLTHAARGHSEDMACNDFFSHTSPTTGSPFDRMIAAGYSYSWAGENIAAGYPDAQAVMTGWMNSQGHRDNILNANFTQIGVGYAYDGGSDYGAYYTAAFGAP